MKDIRVLAFAIMDIQFLRCNRKTNTLTYELVKKARHSTIHPIWIT